jgi:3-deoxy-7-phosphoheptulonate synthase
MTGRSWLPADTGGGVAREEKTPMSRVRDTRIVGYEPLLAPAALLDELPLTAAEAETVERTRAEVRALLDGADGRLLIVTGPCSR